MSESYFGLESWKESYSSLLGFLKVWEWPLKRMWHLWLATFFHGAKKKNCAFHNTIIVMQHNGPSHAARNTSASFRAYLSILKRQIYEDRRHLASKKQLWESVLTSCKDIQAETPKLTSLMDAGIEKLKLMFLNSVNVACILSFSFWKKQLFPLGDLFSILQIWFENYADHCLHRHFRKITENYHLHSNLKCSIYISYIKVFIFVVAL